MEVVGDDWNILELHWTTCKFLLVFCHFLPRAVFAKGLQSSRSFIGNSSSTSFQLPQNSDLFVTSRVKAYSVRKQMHCSQRSSSCMEPCAPPAFVCFFFWKWGLPKICKIVLFLIVFWTMPLNELPDFVPPASVELSDDLWHQVEHGHDEAQCQDCSSSCFRSRSSYDIVILKFMIMTQLWHIITVMSTLD